MTPKLRAVLWCLAIVVPLDQLTKWWVENNISPFEPVPVIEGFFQLTHARNPGAALGLFPDLPIALFIGLSLLALVLIGSFYRQLEPNDRFGSSALGLILGGAIGNLIDRLWRQEVVDFLQFDLGIFVFPDFNVADSAIVIGVGLLLLEVIARETEESVGRGPASDGPEAAEE